MMEVEGGTPECVRAAPAPRVRARGRPRVPLLRRAAVARDLRQPERRLRARDVPPAPLQPELRAAPARTGTRRRTPTRTSPRPSRCGSRTPAEEWRARYRGWKALEKLEYVDALMSEARQKPPARHAARRPPARRGVEAALDARALLRGRGASSGREDQPGLLRRRPAAHLRADARRATARPRPSCGAGARPSSRASSAGRGSASTSSTGSRASSSQRCARARAPRARRRGRAGARRGRVPRRRS